MENEPPIASYPYKDQNQRNAEIVLTQSQLIFVSHQHRDAIPLEGLRSIGVESGRNIGMLITLFFGMALSLGCAAVFGNTIFLQTPNAPVFMKTVPIGMLAIGLVLLGLLVRLRSGFARIVILSDLGTRHYEVATLNQPLLDFVGKVREALGKSEK